MSRRIPKGAKDYSRILVTEDDGGTVTITNQVFEVLDDSDANIQISGAASLRNDGTTAVEIYGLVDTTAAGFVDGEWVKVKFTFDIGADVTKVEYEAVLLKETKL